jgi:hypothetical protein
MVMIGIIFLIILVVGAIIAGVIEDTKKDKEN